MDEPIRYGNYQLLDRLGRGGMGEVWRARHQMLDRLSAIKLVRADGPAGLSPAIVKRFEREARATSKLRSPHTVQVHDYGVSDDGVFFYAMELLDGLDLDAMVRRFGPLSAARLRYLLRQACESLEEAHRAGLVHRDLKPSNLYVCRLGLEHDFVKVLDFGLVKTLHDDDSNESHLTREGTIPGTPAFLAPECVSGRADTRSDIYSFACLAYWCLTGSSVFEGNTPMEVVVRHVEATPEPPSVRSELPVPEAFDALILECLAKDPEARPQTFAELRTRLGDLSIDEDWGPTEAERWWQTHLPAEEDSDFETASRAGEAIDVESPTEAMGRGEDPADPMSNAGNRRAPDSAQSKFADPASSKDSAEAEPPKPTRRPLLWMIPLVLLAITAADFFSSAKDDAKWVHETALPEIERLRSVEEFGAAAELAAEAEALLPEDPVWETLWPTLATPTTLRTDPATEATVRLSRITDPKYFGDEIQSAPEWFVAGQTPIAGYRLPIGAYRVSIEASGFVPYTGIYTCTSVAPGDTVSLVAQLVPSTSFPPGMSTVPNRTLRNWAYGYRGEDPTPNSDTDPPYLMGTREVSNREYKAFVDAGGYTNPEYWSRGLAEEPPASTWEDLVENFRDQSRRPGPSTWNAGTFPEGQADHPVSGVSWYEADAFAAWAGAHLPTLYHWYGAVDPPTHPELTAVSNFDPTGPVAVGTTPFGQYGIHDMIGNVREWSWNKKDESDERFILGGSWNDPSYTPMNGDAAPPLDRSPRNGIRLAMYPYTGAASLAPYLAPIAPPTGLSEDVWTEAVSDDVFAALASQYQYDPLPLESRLESTNTTESRFWTSERVSYRTAYGDERMEAVLFLPRDLTPPFQTVLYYPGAGAIAPVSSQSLQGMGILGPIIESGRAVLYPIYHSTYERYDGIPHNGRTPTRSYADRKIRWIRDVLRSVEYLKERGITDMDRLAYMGLSWGAEMAPIVLALEPELRAAVLMDGGAILQPVLPEANEANFAPHVSVPILMINGSRDYIFPVELSQKPFFERLGTAETDKTHTVYEGGHVIFNKEPEAVTTAILRWLDQTFGAVQ